jgi:hypothetical protein
MLPPNPYAFPRPATEFAGSVWSPMDGMTLRDWFAGQALIGLISQQSSPNALKALLGSDEEVFAGVARITFDYADAMLAAREKGGA